MYYGIQKIEEIIDFIESNITSEIDYEHLASKIALSVYEFRRIFAFIVGCPLSDYIRKRRLTLAACDLIKNDDISIQEIGDKYGYSTSSSFSKAFSEYHGFSPSLCRKGSCDIKLFTRPKFELQIQNGGEHSFKILNDEAFSIHGYSALSENTDSCCCEKVWSDFYDLGCDKEILGDEIFVSYRDECGMVSCCIGERCEYSADKEAIPACRWFCVKMNTTDDDTVNQKYDTIFRELLPSAGLKRRAGVATVEVFPRDMNEDNFEWEIRIPIE